MTNYEFNTLILGDYIFKEMIMYESDDVYEYGEERFNELCKDFWLIYYLTQEQLSHCFINKSRFFSNIISNELLNY